MDPGIISTQKRRPKLEAYHSSAFNAEYTNAWKYASNSTYVFMFYYLIQNKHSFTFTRNLYVERGMRNDNSVRVYCHCFMQVLFVMFQISLNLYYALDLLRFLG
jgi:hypothetical protein